MESLFGAFSGKVVSTATAVSSSRTLIAVSLFGLALLPAGCRRSGIDRLPLHGTVKTAGGEKLNAAITFLPADGKKRPAATASVIQGEYRFDRVNGPTAGRTEVHIRRLIGRGESIPRSGVKTKPKASAKSEWTRFIDVADDGKYLQDFPLEN
jgi:hypothetical protein